MLGSPDLHRNLHFVCSEGHAYLHRCEICKSLHRCLPSLSRGEGKLYEEKEEEKSRMRNFHHRFSNAMLVKFNRQKYTVSISPTTYSVLRLLVRFDLEEDA